MARIDKLRLLHALLEANMRIVARSIRALAATDAAPARSRRADRDQTGRSRKPDEQMRRSSAPS